MNTLSISKVRATLSAIVLAMATMTSATSATAQTAILQVKVPFGFENGSQHLPAGLYTISMETPNLMLIRGDSGGGFAMVNPQESTKPANTSTVVFRRYGQRYFLRDVSVAGSTNSLHCVKSKSEKQLQIARTEPAPTDVEVALVEMPH